MLFTRIILLALTGAILAAAQGTSKWAYLGKDKRLHYGADSRGNRILDFSYAGYKGGGASLPVVRVAKTLESVEGDNTAQIQAAIDSVSSLPPDKDGFRGAVLLRAGAYEVAGTLRIGADGVVLRGSGQARAGRSYA